MRRLENCFILLIFCSSLSATVRAQSENASNLLQEASISIVTAPEKAIKLADYVLKASPSPLVTCEAKLIKAKAYEAIGSTDLAMEWVFDAAIDALPLGNEPVFETQMYACHLFHSLGIPTGTIHFPGLKIAESTPENPGIPDHLKMVIAIEKANQLLIAEDTLGALNYLTIAQKHRYVSNEMADGYGDPVLKMAWISLERSDLDSASNFLAQSQQNRHPQTNTNGQWAERLLLEGAILAKQNSHEEAVTNLNQALKIAEELNHSRLKVLIFNGLMNSHKALGNAEWIRNATEKLYSASAELEDVQNAAINTGHAGMIKLHAQNQAMIESQQKSLQRMAWALLAALILLIGGILLKNRINMNRLADIVKYLEASQKIIETKSFETSSETDGVRATSFSKSTEDLLIQGLEEFERGEKYLNNDMSLAQLATLLDTNTKYLSEFINLHKGKNFNTYINELRIGYIMQKLKSNPIYLNYKVSYLAEESGFSSHSNFTTVFKAISGISPTKFISLIQLEKENKFSEV